MSDSTAAQDELPELELVIDATLTETFRQWGLWAPVIGILTIVMGFGFQLPWMWVGVFAVVSLMLTWMSLKRWIAGGVDGRRALRAKLSADNITIDTEKARRVVPWRRVPRYKNDRGLIRVGGLRPELVVSHRQLKDSDKALLLRHLETKVEPSGWHFAFWVGVWAGITGLVWLIGRTQARW